MISLWLHQQFGLNRSADFAHCCCHMSIGSADNYVKLEQAELMLHDIWSRIEGIQDSLSRHTDGKDVSVDPCNILSAVASQARQFQNIFGGKLVAALAPSRKLSESTLCNTAAANCNDKTFIESLNFVGKFPQKGPVFGCSQYSNDALLSMALPLAFASKPDSSPYGNDCPNCLHPPSSLARSKPFTFNCARKATKQSCQEDQSDEPTIPILSSNFYHGAILA